MDKPPLPTLEDLPRHGVKAIRVWCGGWPNRCSHQANIPIEAVDLTLTIVEFGQRLKCSACGTRGGQAMPAWPESNAFQRRAHTMGYPSQ